MKILHVHDKAVGRRRAEDGAHAIEAVGGGTAIYLKSISEALERRPCDVAFIRLGSRDAETGPHAHEVRAWPFILRRSTLPRLHSLLDVEQPDLIHLHSATDLAHPSILRLFASRAPLILTLHDVTPFCFWQTRLRRDHGICTRHIGFGCVTCGCYRVGGAASPPRDLLRLTTFQARLNAFRRLDLILVPSTYLRDVMIHNGFDARQIQVLPLFSRFAASAPVREETHAPLRLLFAGRLVETKGAQLFIEALGELRETDWIARVVGSGPMAPSLHAQAAALALDDRIEFIDEVSSDGLADHYRWCDISIFPSIAPESFGMAGVEAMAFGKPVVAFPAGGVTQWLRHEENGLLARHADSADLARQLRRLLEVAPMRRRLAEAARRSVASEFNLEAHMGQLLHIYQHALHGARQAAA